MKRKPDCWRTAPAHLVRTALCAAGLLLAAGALWSPFAATVTERDATPASQANSVNRDGLPQLAMRDDGGAVAGDSAAGLPRVLPSPPNVFGSVALRVANTARSQRWHELLAEHGQAYLAADCGSDAVCASPVLRRLRQALDDARSADERSSAAAINKAVNQVINHKSDRDLYGVGDYWAGFRATVERGSGDCEDIAIVKMWMLNALGIALDRIHLVLVRSPQLRADHAVLIVRVGDDALVLDNLSNDVAEDRSAGDDGAQRYLPLLSFGASGEWIHGFPPHRAARGRSAFAAGS